MEVCHKEMLGWGFPKEVVLRFFSKSGSTDSVTIQYDVASTVDKIFLNIMSMEETGKMADKNQSSCRKGPILSISYRTLLEVSGQ